LHCENVFDAIRMLSYSASSSQEPRVTKFALLNSILWPDALFTPQTRQLLHSVLDSRPLSPLLILLKIALSKMSGPEK
jgi:hypothetical protein